MRFEDRRQAGRLLGEKLAEFDPVDPVVLALPRGGVPVGFEVAGRLGCPLDVVLVRKLGVPGQQELAMGAVAEDGVVVRNEGIIELARVTPGAFERELEAEQSVLAERAVMYRGDLPPVEPGGHTVVLVDDGLATGATALAAVKAVRQRGASSVWLAVPVAPVDTSRAMEEVVDRVVVLHQPEDFVAVGVWYRRFDQVDDDEVKTLLAGSRLR